jgi:hypothetical protein
MRPGAREMKYEGSRDDEEAKGGEDRDHRLDDITLAEDHP